MLTKSKQRNARGRATELGVCMQGYLRSPLAASLVSFRHIFSSPSTPGVNLPTLFHCHIMSEFDKTEKDAKLFTPPVDEEYEKGNVEGTSHIVRPAEGLYDPSKESVWTRLGLTLESFKRAPGTTGYVFDLTTLSLSTTKRSFYRGNKRFLCSSDVRPPHS